MSVGNFRVLGLSLAAAALLALAVGGGAALARSLNTVAVRLTERVGRSKVVQAARRLGITSTLKTHPSLAPGASEVSLLEPTAPYAVFANNGRGVWPPGISEIRSAAGERLYRRAGSGSGAVVGRRALRQMVGMLSGVVARGTARAAAMAWPAAGKTGTSQVRNITAAERAAGVIKNEDLPWGRRDHALFVRFAPFDKPKDALSVVVEHGGGGSKVAAPIARDVMMRALYGPEVPLRAYPPGQRPERAPTTPQARPEAPAPRIRT